MTVLYVVSDQEGAGKTALCATLAHKIGQHGVKAAVFKPVAAAGLDSDSDPDAQVYHKLLGQQAEGWPLNLSGGSLTPALLKETKDVIKQVSEGADVVLAEGSCGLSAEESEVLVDALDAKVLVVSRYRHDLSASQLKHWQEALGDRLMGFVINGLTRYQGTDARSNLLPSMESEGLACLGLVPEDRRLLGVSVSQLAEHLGGRFVACEERSGALVEHLIVGGLGMDPGEVHFSVYENKAVIVRGDRPDLQMAALNTSTACIVLTKGVKPIEYVRYEAEQEEVSLMVVEGDTLSTMDALSTLVDMARFDHPLKLDRYGELLEQHVDMAGLFSGLGVKIS